MSFVKAKFIKSAADKSGWINDDLPEVCFVGKSNVGKSSLINNLVNQKKLAKTSKTPGCTKLLNFFEIDEKFRIVDAPGYGYAKAGRNAYDNFDKLMGDYLYQRENLKAILLLVDSRHEPSPLDIEMYQLIKESKHQFLIVATKADQLNQSLRAKCLKNIASNFPTVRKENIFLVSNKDKNSLDNLEAKIKEMITSA